MRRDDERDESSLFDNPRVNARENLTRHPRDARRCVTSLFDGVGRFLREDADRRIDVGDTPEKVDFGGVFTAAPELIPRKRHG